MTDSVRLKFVALGDSLTVGFQSPSMFLPGKEEFPYTRLLDIILSRELPRKSLDHIQVSFRNAGMLGGTVRSMLERFDIHVAAEEPDHVIIWGGINDLFMLRTPKNIAGDLRQIYGRALEVGIGPIACTTTPIIGPNELVSSIVELNDMVRGYCIEDGVPLADLFAATSDESEMLRETFSSDGVHLSHAGYQRVAYTLYYEVIEPILDGLKN